MNDQLNQPDNNVRKKRTPVQITLTLETVRKLVRIITIISSLFFLIPIIALILINQQLKDGCTEKVTAVVTDLVESTFYHEESHSSSIVYAPLFEYTYNGVKYSSSNKSYNSDPFFEIGQETEIFINPDDPTKVYSPEDGSIRTMITILFVLWSGYIIIGAVIIPETLFRKKSSESCETKKYYKGE